MGNFGKIRNKKSDKIFQSQHIAIIFRSIDRKILD